MMDSLASAAASLSQQNSSSHHSSSFSGGGGPTSSSQQLPISPKPPPNASSSTSSSSSSSASASASTGTPSTYKRCYKKSWTHLRNDIQYLRTQLSNVSNMMPINVNFRTLSDGRIRIYYLSKPPTGWETTLLYVDVQPIIFENQQTTDGTVSEDTTKIRTGSTIPMETTTTQSSASSSSSQQQQQQQSPPLLQWHHLLEPSPFFSASAHTSREVQLLLERRRVAIWGITSYELHKSSGKIVFPASSSLYQCLDTGYNPNAIFPTQLRICPTLAALEPQFCPHNSDIIAYITGADICVTHTLAGLGQRLTFAHGGRRNYADDPLTAGVPSYVMQEEFNRYQGFWWQPNSDDGIYRIIYEEVDESDVCLFTFPSSQSSSGEYEEYRFPRAGTPNAKSKLKLVQFQLSESLQIVDVATKDLQYPLAFSFPWLEYIVRVGWTPDSKYIWAQLMNRKQQRLDLILIPLDNFCESFASSSTSTTTTTTTTTATTTTTSPITTTGATTSSTFATSGVGTDAAATNSAESTTTNTNDFSWKSTLGKKTSPIQVLYSQTASTWINVSDTLYFLEMTDKTVTYIWSSEESGYRHLYLITSSLVGGAVHNGTDITDSTMADDHFDDDSILVPRILKKVALTSGEWEVLGRNIWVDKNRQLVYFLGLKESPLEKHLYVVSLNHPERIRLLTVPGYSYSIEINEECSILLQVYCNTRRLPTCEIFQIVHHTTGIDNAQWHDNNNIDSNKLNQNDDEEDGGDDGDGDEDGDIDMNRIDGGRNSKNKKQNPIDNIELVTLGYLMEGTLPANVHFCPSIYSPRLASGDQLYAMVFKPHNFRLGVRYPTILNVYGGPEVQIVNNTFKGMRQLRLHMLAAQGYCVVCIDSRGSKHRGVKFESHIRCRMGRVELNDQVEVLKMLAEQLGYIDMDRVAIHGWSYGGYLSLMGLIQHPGIFKVAIAGAPVTNWELYDTGYTERYMDLPENNPTGYADGSVLNYIRQFPEDENRLLLIHGLIDENVHFLHTSQLINQLIKLNKPYQLQIYPNERHSLRTLDASRHYETTLLSFLQNNL